ncbi:hypothetical protein BB561_006822 [Smittium simulii]|nr:hypothetical protein BB561_006822 [Smittium simulii]
MYSFYNSFSIYLNTLRSEGLSAAYCDSNYTTWNSGMFQLAYIFYLSKYYEVVDTAIILLKGRRSSTLQTYHHAGAIMCMFLGVYYVPSAIFYFVVVNSFIHSIMYSYYALSSLGFHPPGKKYLTSLQITQFLLGFIYAPYTIFKPNCSNSAKVLLKNLSNLFI